MRFSLALCCGCAMHNTLEFGSIQRSSPSVRRGRAARSGDRQSGPRDWRSPPPTRRGHRGARPVRGAPRARLRVHGSLRRRALRAIRALRRRGACHGPAPGEAPGHPRGARHRRDLLEHGRGPLPPRHARHRGGTPHRSPAVHRSSDEGEAPAREAHRPRSGGRPDRPAHDHGDRPHRRRLGSRIRPQARRRDGRHEFGRIARLRSSGRGPNDPGEPALVRPRLLTRPRRRSSRRGAPRPVRSLAA